MREGEGVVIKGKHRIVVGAAKEGAKISREQMDSMFSPPVQFFGSANGNVEEMDLEGFPPRRSVDLPPQIAMITLAKVHGEENTFMVRLAHQYGIGEDVELSKGAKVDMNKILPFGMEIAKWEETTLTGNQGRKEWEEKRLSWKGQEKVKGVSGRDLDDGDEVVINAMEIRTFKVKVKGGGRDGVSRGGIREIR